MYDTKVLKKYLDEFADCQLRIESDKEVQNSIKESVKDATDMKPADFTNIARLYYLNKYDSDKFEKAKEKAEHVGFVEGLNV